MGLNEHAADIDEQTAINAALAAEVDQLRQALASNRVIGQATGILMQRSGWTAERAFRAIRDASMRRNEKVITIALEIVASAEDRAGH